ncbi:MAG: serine/threonine-protein kinase [Huintestinicola sp.]|uniref:serine/threonine-protein kinase n=1 Tax=Huintestinicola sp. TaxID=2981661 RepID=UPI003EFE5E12
MGQLLKGSERGCVYVQYDENGKKVIKRVICNGCKEVYELLGNNPHPFMPKVISVTSDEKGIIVTEEYIEGRIISEACFTEKAMVNAAKELCSVLSHIHRLGIVHRDIKPSNILLADDGHIRLIDFDAARTVKPSADSDTRYLGTEGFAPPEQYGFSQTDKRSDIYALGKTLECIFGSLAFDKKYRDMISKCTRLDPENRYSDAGDVLKDLNGGRLHEKAAIISALIVSLLIAAVVFIRNSDDDVDMFTEELTASVTAAAAQEEDPFYTYRSYFKNLDFEKAERIPAEQMEKPLLFETAEDIPMEYIIIDTASLKENKFVSMIFDYNNDGCDDIFQLSAYKPEWQEEYFRSLCVSVVSMVNAQPDFHVISDNTYFPVLFSAMSMNQETGMLYDDRYIQLSAADINGDERNEVILSVGRPGMLINTHIFYAENSVLEYSTSVKLSVFASSIDKVFYDGERLDDKEQTLSYMDLENTIGFYKLTDLDMYMYEREDDPLYQFHQSFASKK